MKKVVILLVLLGVTSPLFAQWTKTGGPIGGLGYDIRINPDDHDIMFVTDNWSGVNRSSNAGETWSATNSGITVRAGPTDDAIPIFSLTMDPNDSDRLWAGTQAEGEDFGIFRSDDGGATWNLMVEGIELGDDIALVFRGFTVQSGNSNIVYAQAEVPTTTQGREFNRTKGRIYKSTDAGESWLLIWEGDSLARYLIIDPSDSNTLYASTGIFDREAFNSDCADTPGGVGVIKSTNGGTTWTEINSGLTDLYVGALRMHPSNSSILFAATGNNACSDGGSTSGLFKTTNGGTSWTKVKGDDIMTTINFSSADPDIVYAASAQRFYRSTDGGDEWEELEREEGVWGPDGIRAGVPIDVTVDSDDSDILYVNNYGGGVFKSIDGAETWETWSTGYTGAEVTDLDTAPQASGLVFVIGRSGPFRSVDGGDSWTGIAHGDSASYAEWYSIRQKPDDPDTILIADEHQGTIFRSDDRGDDFSEVLRQPESDASNSDRRQGFKALAFASSNTNVVYAGLSRDQNAETTTTSGTVIYKSDDAGETWDDLSSSMDGSGVNALAVDPEDEDIVYAGTTSGLFRSTNGGSSWSQLSNLGDRDIRAVTIDSANTNILFAGEHEGGVWKSTDGGDNWSGPNNTGFSSANPSVWSILLDPDDTAIVYASDWTSGVYRSTDGGVTWAGFPDADMSGLSTRAVKDLAISADGEVLYVATQGEGVFRFGTATSFDDGEDDTGSDGGDDDDDGAGSSGGGCSLVL